MSPHIEFYVEQLLAQVMANVAMHSEKDLYHLANDMIDCHHEDEHDKICQAYEVVKHQLLG
ncbi:MAG: hypothetical protein GX072_08395 [Lysinibacillus sp.]|nr:hypothetical protein [Lysinibacillus sp.]